MKGQIFITMDGGLIQDINVSADLEDVEVTVVDFDIEGVPEKDIRKTPYGTNAMIYREPTEIITDEVLKFWEKILAEKNK